jgi:hypothetical protein
MAVGIGAAGILGIALETVSGTYLAPTKYIPFESESLNFVSENAQRRPIRQSADIVGIVPGNQHVEGDIGFEALPDAVAILLHAARHTVVKTGAGPYTYVFTPNANALPVKTLSITLVKNGQVFAFTGMVIGSFTITPEDGVLKFNCSFQGRDEATQPAPTPTWPTTVPFGMGMYTIEIPTATQVFDTDTFEFQVEQNAEPQYRLKSGGQRGAQFIKYGENEVTLSVERDFENKTEYDQYKALTAKTITIKCINGANEIDMLVPVSIIDTYDVTTPGQGDLVRASISYFGTLDATGKSYEITVKTTENII